jgi:hypothetical protein
MAYLTQPAPGVILLNIQIDGGEFQRVEITKAQLGNIIVDGAAIALRAAPTLAYGP